MKWLAVAGFVAVAAGMALAGQDARVLADRVNLRALPLDNAEVAGQANQGDSLAVLRQEGDWVEVQAPTNVAVWIKGEFINDGVLKADKVNVRSGPGLSYRPVGTLRGGTAVQIREARGEWTGIVPPAGISLWVKTQFLQMPGASPAPPATATLTFSGTVVASTPTPSQVVMNVTRDLPEGVRVEQLAPVLGQGAVIERQGVAGRVPMAMFRGVEYRLVDGVEGKKVTVAYVRGRDAEIAALLGQRVAAKGRGWWLNGERCPLLYPDTLAPVTTE